MLIAFQVILLIVIISSTVVACGEYNDKRQANMMLISVMGIIAFLVTVIWL